MKTVLLLVVAVAFLADGLASGVAFQGFFQPSNILGYVLVYGAGFTVTGIVAVTGLVWKSGSPLLLKLVWFLSVIVDVYTTYMATIFYVFLGHPLSEAPTIESLPSLSVLLGAGTGQAVQTMLVLFLPLIIAGATMLSGYAIEKGV